VSQGIHQDLVDHELSRDDLSRHVLLGTSSFFAPTLLVLPPIDRKRLFWDCYRCKGR
jgi:hypothetical protein